MFGTGRIKKGEDLVRFYTPIIPPEDKVKPTSKPRKKRWSKFEENMFLFECVMAGLITQEFYDNTVKRKK
jgi:hypothetical protein